MNISQLVTRITFRNQDGTVSAPALGLKWPNQEAADRDLSALLPELARTARRELTAADFPLDGNIGLTRPRSRDAMTAHQDQQFQRSQYPSQTERLSTEELLARHAEDNLRRHEESKLNARERLAIETRRKADEAAARNKAEAAHAAVRAQPSVAKALNAARMAAIRVAFDADADDRDVEFARHNLKLLETTLDVAQFNTNHVELLRPLAERKATKLAELEQHHATDISAKKAELATLRPSPETPQPKAFAWDRDPEPAESVNRYPMTRVYHDGRSTVIPTWMFELYPNDPAVIAETAASNGSHEDAVLQPGDAPAGKWS